MSTFPYSHRKEVEEMTYLASDDERKLEQIISLYMLHCRVSEDPQELSSWLARQFPDLPETIRYLAGIVCGHYREAVMALRREK